MGNTPERKAYQAIVQNKPFWMFFIPEVVKATSLKPLVRATNYFHKSACLGMKKQREIKPTSQSDVLS